MSDPLSAGATYFSVTKIWSIAGGVCGSVIPILALADRKRVTFTNALFMALTGSSFSIFVGPWVSQKISLNSMEGIGALSWAMGTGGVFIVRAFLSWMEKKSERAIGNVIDKFVGSNNRNFNGDDDELTK